MAIITILKRARFNNLKKIFNQLEFKYLLAIAPFIANSTRINESMPKELSYYSISQNCIPSQTEIHRNVAYRGESENLAVQKLPKFLQKSISPQVAGGEQIPSSNPVPVSRKSGPAGKAASKLQQKNSVESHSSSSGSRIRGSNYSPTAGAGELLKPREGLVGNLRNFLTPQRPPSPSSVCKRQTTQIRVRNIDYGSEHEEVVDSNQLATTARGGGIHSSSKSHGSQSNSGSDSQPIDHGAESVPVESIPIASMEGTCKVGNLVSYQESGLIDKEVRTIDGNLKIDFKGLPSGNSGDGSFDPIKAAGGGALGGAETMLVGSTLDLNNRKINEAAGCLGHTANDSFKQNVTGVVGTGCNRAFNGDGRYMLACGSATGGVILPSGTVALYSTNRLPAYVHFGDVAVATGGMTLLVPTGVNYMADLIIQDAKLVVPPVAPPTVSKLYNATQEYLFNNQ